MAGGWEVPVDVAGEPVLAGFTAWMDTARPDLAARTRGTYAERVAHFLSWLSGPAAPAVEGDPLASRAARDAAVSAYLAAAVAERGVAASTVNVSHAALALFYRWLGVGAPHGRVPPGPVEPRALGEREERALLRAAAARGPRTWAMVVLLLDAGPTESELARLDTGDVDLDAIPTLRLTGSDARQRTVALRSATAVALRAWLAERRLLAPQTPALFTTVRPTRGRRGRLALRTIDIIVRAAGTDAGLDLSPRVLRGTAEARMLREGLAPHVVAARLGVDRPDPARHAALLDRPGRRRGRQALTETEQLMLFGDTL